MAKFLTTTGCLHAIEKIILESSTYLVLVSPYIRLSQNLYERLSDANARGVEIVVVFGKEELLKDAREFFEEIGNLACYYHPRLHAKCYFNHKELLMSSLNLYESSNKDRNREMGFLFNMGDDIEMSTEVKNECSSIIRASKIVKSKIKNNVISYHFDKPDLGKLTSKNYYLYSLYDALRKDDPKRSTKWSGSSIIVSLPHNLCIDISHRINLRIPEEIQDKKEKIYRNLQRADCDYRLYGEDSWNICIYPALSNGAIMDTYRKESIIENFIKAVHIIEETLS